MGDVTFRAYRPEDFPAWVRMRTLLWPDEAEDGASAWLTRRDAAVLLAERTDGALCGFAEVGERAYADGCDTAPIAFLEGWYVDDVLRGQGIGRGLVAAAVSWAAERGYREMASDALLADVASQRAHVAVGFVEVERAVRYRRAV